VTTCGLWAGQRGLVAVLLDRTGRKRYCHVTSTDDARAGFACWLSAAGADLVIDNRILATDPIADIARRAGVTVWVAPLPLVAALRHAAGLIRGSPRLSATLLARLPAIPWLRSHLRRLEPGDSRQIMLL